MQKKRKLKWIPIVAAVVVIAALTGVGIYYFGMQGTNAEEGTSKRTYQVQAVTKDELSVDISGNGTLTPAQSESIIASYSGTVTAVNKKVGDTVKAGEVIATVSSEQLDNQIEQMEDKLNQTNVKLAETDQTTSSKYITAEVAGVIKQIKASSGDLAEDVVQKNGFLCVISTDGKMQVTFETKKGIKKYASVTVKLESSSETGTVTAVNGNQVTVEIDENSYKVGKAAKVYNSGGKLLGSGKLSLCDTVEVSNTEGKISSVLVSENESVYSGESLFKLSDYTLNTEYESLKQEKEEIKEQLEDLQRQKNISVDFSGTIAALPIETGDSVNKETTLCTVNGKKGFKLTVSVDELDISDLTLGARANITLDALDGNYEGEVTYISNVGNTESSVTNYDVVITTDDIEGAYSGMNASATITTQSSGESLVVPVDAVQGKNGGNYVYLAPDGSQAGDEVEQSSVNKSDLTQVTVTTGMSDGSFIVVTGDGLSEGTLIYVPVVTTTSESSGSSQKQEMFGNMQGGGMNGEMPGGGGERPDFAGKDGSSGGSGGAPAGN